MEKIKILHVNTSLIAGGVERLLDELLPLIKQNRNFEVELFLLEKSEDEIFEKTLIKNGIKIIYSNYKKKFDIRVLYQLRKLIENYDIIHTHIFPSQFYIPIVTIGLKVKPYLITTEHSTDNNRRKYKYLYIIERYLYLKYNKIISISKETQNNLLKWLKLEKRKLKTQKFITIENGVNLKKFSSKNVKIEKNYFEKERKQRIITMIGRFDVQKDQITLIKAIKDIEDIFLFLVGDGPLKKIAEDITKELNIEDKVKFLGTRKDIPQILKITDISVLSSNYEGFGLVAIESMASNKPIIISDVDGLMQVVGDGGVIFNKKNVDDLKEKIELLIKDKKYYEKVVEKGLKVSKKYDLEKTLNNYLQLYLRREDYK